MSNNIDDVTGCVHGMVWGCRDCMIDRLTRERDEARDRIVALEAQLTTRGACECGADEVCALARRAQEAEARVAAAEARVRELERALREVRQQCTCNGLGGFYTEVRNAFAVIERTEHQPKPCPSCARIDALLTPTAPAAGAGLCSARVNSAGNLCLMPAGHAGDHYPPTERALQVIVRTDGTGPNPTPPQEET